MKLSKKQKEVINRLRKGEILHTIQGINARCFFVRMNVSWATIYKLETLSLIKRHSGYVELTELGKTIEL